MKFSDAVLLGSTMIKPMKAKILSPELDAGCALGMGIIASVPKEQIHPRLNGKNLSLLYSAYPWLKEEQTYAPCPIDKRCGGFITLSGVITHLFDEHLDKDMTFEQLIEHIKAMEPKEEETETMADLWKREEQVCREALLLSKEGHNL